MQDLPGSGIEPVSPVLADSLPWSQPGKPQRLWSNWHFFKSASSGSGWEQLMQILNVLGVRNLICWLKDSTPISGMASGQPSSQDGRGHWPSGHTVSCRTLTQGDELVLCGGVALWACRREEGLRGQVGPRSGTGPPDAAAWCGFSVLLCRMETLKDRPPSCSCWEDSVDT